MKKFIIIIIFLATSKSISQKQETLIANCLYKTDDLVITQVSKNSYIHTSFLETSDFGKIPCNGLIVSNKNEIIIFDTPVDDKSSEDLIWWICNVLHKKINAVVISHFHNDALGGIKTFCNNNIPSFAFSETIQLAQKNNLHGELITNIFQGSIILKVGNKKVIAKFFGQGHTKDNIVGYFPTDKILFGGCLLKALNASKGNLDDANVSDWLATVEKVKKEYPKTKIVIPGHGDFGDKKLLDYTINMFSLSPK